MSDPDYRVPNAQLKKQGNRWVVCDSEGNLQYEHCPCCGLPFKTEKAAQAFVKNAPRHLLPKE